MKKSTKVLTEKHKIKLFLSREGKNLKLSDNDINFIYNSLMKEGKVRIYDLGTLEIRRINSRKFFHNFSNKEITTRSNNRLHFRPFTKAKKKIQDYV